MWVSVRVSMNQYECHYESQPVSDHVSVNVSHCVSVERVSV